MDDISGVLSVAVDAEAMVDVVSRILKCEIIQHRIL
jgi:hypothetical protein